MITIRIFYLDLMVCQSGFVLFELFAIFSILKHKKTVTSIVLISLLITLAYNLDGAHQEVMLHTRRIWY